MFLGAMSLIDWELINSFVKRISDQTRIRVTRRMI